MTIVDAGLSHLFLLPISSQPPLTAERALEIPALEATRAGLRHWKRCWICIDEYNYDVLPLSWHFDSGRPPRGRFSDAFLRQIVSAFLGRLRGKAAERVDRTV